ncbi:MAG: FG-GAP repeat domain-containing protein [Baekduiaceae bacterium]
MFPVRAVTGAVAAGLLLAASPALAVPTVSPHTTISGLKAYATPTPVGDVNGDGREDLLVVDDPACSAPATIVFGGESGATVNAAEAGPRVLRITRTGTGSWCADPVRAAGDVNGDGRGDLVVDGETIVLGRGAGTVSTDDAAATWRLTTSAETSMSVRALAPVGDVNGDGRDDVALYPTGTIAFGRPGASGTTNVDTLGSTEALRIVRSAGGFGYYGPSLQRHEDINRDGRDEVILRYETYTPGYVTRIAVVAGRAGGTVDVATASSSSVMEVASGDELNWAADLSESYGDVDGDGVGDRSVRITSGWSVLLSSKLKLPYTQSQVLPAGIAIRGDAGLGAYPLASVGDQSGDGRVDLGVGASSVLAGTGAGYVTAGPEGARWTYLVLGSAAPRAVSLGAVSQSATANRLDSVPPGHAFAAGVGFDQDPRQELAFQTPAGVQIYDVVDRPVPADPVVPTLTGVTRTPATITTGAACGIYSCTTPTRTTVTATSNKRQKLQLTVKKGTATAISASVWADAGTHTWSVAAHRDNGPGWSGPFYEPKWVYLPTGAYTVQVSGMDLAGRKTAMSSFPLTIVNTK